MSKVQSREELRIQSSPRALRKKGSYEWAVQLRAALKRLWESRELTRDMWNKDFSEAKSFRIWRPLGHRNIDEFLKKELGITPSQLKERWRDDVEEHGELPAHGGDRRGGEQAYIVSLKLHGNDASYLARRIKRDSPDVFKRLDAGEFRSVRQAAIAAGIVKVPTRLEIAQKAFLKLSPGERKRFLSWCAEQEGK